MNVLLFTAHICLPILIQVDNLSTHQAIHTSAVPPFMLLFLEIVFTLCYQGRHFGDLSRFWMDTECAFETPKDSDHLL